MAAILAFGMFGGWELLVIGGVALLFFGNRVPGMARSLGQGIVEFRKGLKGEDSDEEKKLPEAESEKKKEESA